MKSIAEKLKTATSFIDGNPNVRTSTFSLNEGEYVEFNKMNLKSYKIVSENLNVDNDSYIVTLAKGHFNWLTGGYH